MVRIWPTTLLVVRGGRAPLLLFGGRGTAGRQDHCASCAAADRTTPCAASKTMRCVRNSRARLAQE